MPDLSVASGRIRKKNSLYKWIENEWDYNDEMHIADIEPLVISDISY